MLDVEGGGLLVCSDKSTSLFTLSNLLLITAPFASYSAVQLSMHCCCAVRRDNEEKNHPFHKKQQEWCDELHEIESIKIHQAKTKKKYALTPLSSYLDSPSLSRGACGSIGDTVVRQ